MAVILNSKPRVRLPPGDLPEPKLVRSRSWLPYYVALWICAVIVGHGIVYRWLPFVHRNDGPAPDTRVQTENTHSSFEAGRLARTQPYATPALPMPSAITRPTISKKPAIDLDHLPSCDVSGEQDPNQPEPAPLLPVDLSRSVVGKLLDSRGWTRPCRGRRSTRAHVCLAVKSGNILGATVHTDPRDPSLERCIVRAASLVDLEPEDILRVVKLDVEIAPER